MTELVYSPLPWAIKKLGDDFIIIDAASEIIAEPDYESDARFIVAAVNSRIDYAPLEMKYAELLAAAKYALDQMDPMFYPVAREKLKAAISASEESTP